MELAVHGCASIEAVGVFNIGRSQFANEGVTLTLASLKDS